MARETNVADDIGDEIGGGPLDKLESSKGGVATEPARGERESEVADDTDETEGESQTDDDGGDDESGSEAAAPATSAQVDAVLEAFKARGIDTSAYKDGSTFVQDLLGDYQQKAQAARELQQRMQAYEQHMAQQQALAQQQAQAAQAQAAQQPATPWWNPPQQPRNAAEYLVKNAETGKVEWSPDTPPEVKSAYQAWKSYREDFTARLLENPGEALRPMLEEYTKNEVNRLVEERLASHVAPMQDNFAAQNVLNQHVFDLAVLDQNGRPMSDGRGGVMLNETGKLVTHFVREAISMGINDYGQQMQYGRRMASLYQMQQQQHAAARDAAARKAVRENSSDPKRTTQPRGAGVKTAPVEKKRMSLHDRMRANLAKANKGESSEDDN